MSERMEQNGTPWAWTLKKEAVALAVAEGKKIEAVLAEYGIGRTTFYRWAAAPEFKRRVDEHIAEVVEEARRIIRKNAAKAAQKIVDIAEFGNNQHNARLAAAKDILDRAGIKTPDKLDIVADVNLKGYIGVSPDDWDEPTETD